MKKRFLIILSCACAMLLLASALTLSVLATGSESDIAAQNTTVDPFDEAEGDRFYSGTCGNNLTWTLNVTTGKLRISGSGAMQSYTYDSDIPWFNYTSYVRELVVDDGVTSISQYAFSGCHCLNVVYIGKNVTSIGYGAFTGCTNLAEVCNTSNLSITMHKQDYNTAYGYLGYWAKSIVKSASASNILRKDGFVFWKNSYGEYELLHYEGRDTDISLPEAPIGEQSAYSISDLAFYYEKELTSVDIPNCVTKIGESAFTNCFGLTKLYIPDSVYTMSRFAVSGCSNLLWVRLGSGLAIMGGEYAGSYRPPFNNCPSILEVCNDSQFEMVADTYSEDFGITAEHVYSSESGESKFIYDGNYTIFDRDGVSTLIKYTGDNTIAYIPDYVEAIEANAFNNVSSIELVVIPSSVKSMAPSSFVDCKNITEIAAPFVGKSREESARLIDIFKNSTGALESFTLTEGDGISKNAFAYCYALKDISFPSGITYIGEYAFYECRSLTEFTVPDSVTEIGKNAFGHCSSLKSITLPFVGNRLDGEDNTHFGYIFGANSYSQNNTEVPTSLELVTITKATAIDEYAFYNCDDIITVTLPKKLNSIGKNAFKGCTSLFEIFNPSRVYLSVGTPHESCITDNALAIRSETNNYTGIIRVDGFVFFRDISTDIYTLLRYKGDETEIVFPDNIYASSYTVEAIYSYAFANNDNITSITLPVGVKTIGESAFANCTSLKTLNVPSTVETFPYSAIDGCTSLTFNSKDGGNYLGNDACPYSILVSVDGTEIDKLALQDTAKFILKNAFKNITSIDTLTIPADILHIDNGAFPSSTQIVNLEAPAHAIPMIPKSALVSATVSGSEELPEKAFYQAVKLKSVALNERLAVIGNSAFFGCRSLESIDLTNIFRIDANAFEGCSSLESVVLHHITEVSESCFKNCTSLKSVSLNDEIELFSKDAFFGCSALSKVIVRSSIMSIVGDEFENEYANPLFLAGNLYINDEAVEKLDLPWGIGQVKNYTFAGIRVSSLTIPEDVLIDEKAFFSACGIEKLSAPAYVIPFIPKESLKEAVITSGDTVSSNSFKDAFKLERVTLGDQVTTIEGSAFSSCASLKELYIQSDAVAFGENAFFSSSGKLEKVVINEPENWLNMSFANEKANPLSGAELHAVSAGGKVDSIFIPQDIAEISAYAFIGCTSIREIHLAGAETTVGKDAFVGASFNVLGIHTSQINQVATLLPGAKMINILSGEAIPQNAFTTAQALEEIFLCDSLTEIGDYAFHQCVSLKNVTIPQSVSVIGDYAFSNCTALESVTLPSNLTAIPSGLFSGCSALDYLLIPSLVTEIGSYAFSGCKSFSAFPCTPGSAVTTIGSYAFSNCSALTEVVIPDSVTTVERYAFAYCSSLETMCIPNTVTSLDAYALEQCSSLKSITCSIEHLSSPYLPALETAVLTGGTKLPGSIFYNCENIKNVTLPDTLTTIDEYALSNCDKITSLRIPASVTSIASNAFYKCTALESIYVDSLEAWLNISFSSSANPLCYAKNLYVGGELLTELVIPEEVTEIGSYAFESYKALTSVTLHGNMSVGYRAFYNCDSIEKVNTSSLSDWLTVKFSSIESNPLYYSGTLYVGDEILTNIVIPEDITAIGSYAFAGIKSVETVYIPETVTSFGSQMFEYATGIEEIVCCSENYGNLTSGIGWNVSTTLINHRYEIVAGEESHHWVCSECKAELSPENHSWSYDPIEKLSPTHTEPGYAIYSCICGQTMKDILDPVGHYFGYQTEYLAPTHTSEGKYVFACDCGETTTVPIEKLTEHQYDSGTVTVAPTHTELGVMTYACECGESYTEEIPTLDEHEWGEWQVVDDYLHAKHCSCGISESDYHYFDNDYDSECDICGFTRTVETESVTDGNSESESVTEKVTNAPTEKPTQSPSSSEPSESDKTTNTSGGCSSSLGGASLAVSLMGAVALLFCRKKKED